MFALSIKRVVGLSRYATNGVQPHLPLQLCVERVGSDFEVPGAVLAPSDL
ncbi:hypothetical protein K788_0000720 [Paraburkholderia caribensis MBA4]|uniref:Uncharacterized protein n=1 Tax=Paraburkholderia caribensis MBA4 TaxID=1323664 RepID=A0A0P0RI66_9BURK|nr:hypothetical protein K788_0000720 [Paraburkholderia caribensis MBA4]